MEKKEGLLASVRTLHGVGDVRASQYAAMGVETLEDLVRHYPRAYENRGEIFALCDAPEDTRCALLLTVATEPKVSLLKGGKRLLKFRAYDESGVCEIAYFNQDYLKKVFLPGAEFRFWGKVEKKGGRYQMAAPAAEPAGPGVELADLLPVYPLTEGLSQNQIAKDMAAALSLAATAQDLLPEEIRQRRKLCTLSFALRNIHRPENYAALAAAKRRLIYDEFFLFALGMSGVSRAGRGHGAPVCADGDLSPFLARLPFALTSAQARVVEEIRRDMASDVPMRRMVTGDVGCGKTVCAAAALYLAVRNGRQGALMAPTEILAQQHFADLEPLFAALGIECRLLTGSTPTAAKNAVKRALGDGSLPLVVGTQALLSDGVSFARPGVVVTDEQHRFGVNQRAALSKKNGNAHVLVMSATPIPRSLALVLYGDLALSKVDEMPPGRQRVDTFAVDESYRERLLAFIRKQADGGGQVYVVCPAVEEREEPEGVEVPLSAVSVLGDAPLAGACEAEYPLKTAVGYAKELQEALPELSVAFLHGRMKAAEKDAVMKEFVAGRVQVLVSTTVIEVGVNVPAATLMIVENAERFGLSQLHQLRGRVGRGKRKSYCVLVSDCMRPDAPGGETARQRLQTMRSVYDGYAVAEKDLELRGPGDFLAAGGDNEIRQSGGLRFRLASLCDDSGVFSDACADAGALRAQDPTLAVYATLRQAVDGLFAADRDALS